MARIRLASRYDGHAPGDVVEIPDDMLRPLTRDGRVAEVLPGEAEAPTAVEPELPSTVSPRRSRKGGDG